MGYDASAVGVVGIRLKPGVIKAKLYTEEQVPGCGHIINEDVKFCPECGKEALKTVYKAIDGYDEEERELFGYKLVDRGEGYYDDPEFIAYYWTAHLGPRDIRTFPMRMMDNMSAIQEEMQAKLHPLGLYDKKAFGIHVFLNESC